MTELGTMPALDALFAQLHAAGEALAPPLRRQLLDHGQDAVPGLLATLASDDLAAEDAPAGGWPPIHAVDLLAELHADAAIAPLLRVLREGDLDTVLANQIMVRLPDFGAVALEPVLAELAATDETERRLALCEVLSNLGERDERVWSALVSNFDAEPALCAGFLAGYGDPRGVELIEKSLYEFDDPDGGDWALHQIHDLVEAYEELAGEMPEELRAHVDALKTSYRPAAPAPAASTKVGRNEPCPCGSGKKYKRCCAA